MGIKKWIALLLAVAMMLCLVACGEAEKEDEAPREEETTLSQEDPSKETEPEQTRPKETKPVVPKPQPTEPQEEEVQVAGRYWLYQLSDPDVELDYEMICQAGVDSSYVDLKEDGTGVLALTDEDPEAFIYDLDDKTITDDTGETMGFRVDGEKLTIVADEYTFVFLLEGSDLLDQEFDSDDEYAQVAGRYLLYYMNAEGIEIDYEMICKAGMDGSYLELNEDGTGVMALTDEEPLTFTYDLDAMILTTEDGEEVQCKIDGEAFMAWDEETEVIFVLEGSDLLDQEFEDSEEYAEVAGRYWLYYMYTDGTEIDYEAICQAGVEGSYLDLNEDGTGVMALTGEDPIEFIYDVDAQTMVDDDGDVVDFLIVDEKVQLWNDDTEVVFVREGSDLLDQEFDTQDDPSGTYWLYAIESDGMEMGYDIICAAGLEESNIVLHADGTGVMYLTDEDPVEFKYDLEAGVLEDAIGDEMEIRVEGETLTIESLDGGDVLIFLEEGSQLLG